MRTHSLRHSLMVAVLALGTLAAAYVVGACGCALAVRRRLERGGAQWLAYRRSLGCHGEFSERGPQELVDWARQAMFGSR